MLNTSSNIIIKAEPVDDYTRCIHYHSPLDIIAIKFKCCNNYYPCYYCHQEEADHASEVWTKNEFNTKAIICGVCKYEMTIDEYLHCNDQCVSCNSKFNPKCTNHHHLYFEK